jgi:hypothetical protein
VARPSQSSGVNILEYKQILAETYSPEQIARSKYLRVAQVLAGYPWKRAKLYELISKGEVKSFVLKEKGAIRGIRLIDKDSLDAYLEAKAAQAQEVSE